MQHRVNFFKAWFDNFEFKVVFFSLLDCLLYQYSNQNYLPTENDKTLRHHNIPQPSQWKYLESNSHLWKKRFFPWLSKGKDTFLPSYFCLISHQQSNIPNLSLTLKYTETSLFRSAGTFFVWWLFVVGIHYKHFIPSCVLFVLQYIKHCFL